MLRIRNIFFQFKTLSRKVTMSLTRQEAELRSLCFTNDYVNNQVYIELQEGQRYKALVRTQFSLKKLDANLFIDWQGEQVQMVEVNGATLQKEQIIDITKPNKLYLPMQNLKEGANELLGQTMKFENAYQTTGHGLHSFIDSTDQSQYIYSQCEPYHASKMFPCFDQPDLKGHFKLYALAPIHWVVISNEQRVDFKDYALLDFLKKYEIFANMQGQQIWEFISTKPLSTYLYAILSGAYSQILCPAEFQYGSIGMSIYCRASLLKFVLNDSNEIFSLTSNAIKYFEKLFGFPYPFSKYDQIFCPEYSTGAMENAGAVTINDVYVFREDVPVAQRADRQNTITHELSHMWFGDLVTMKWWDDLWLNESFAEFVSHLCLWAIRPKEIEGVDMWVQFYERKIWGYVEDQMQTTHPIYCEIENTCRDQSENIFDGITYAKGAALLKQLYFIMGEQTFSKAMGLYFNKFQYRNSTLSDFFEMMQQAFQEDGKQFDLKLFRDQWIMKAGLNQVLAEINGDELIIRQEGVLKEHPTLRNQMFKIAFYDVEGTEISIKSIALDPISETVIKFQDLDLTKVKGFILNYNDESFIKTLYSKEQAKFLLQNLSKFFPSLSRVLVLRSIWDQVRDGQVCFLDFVDGVVNHLTKENDDTVNKMVLSWCSGGIDFYSPRVVRPELRDRLANTVYEMIIQTDKANINKLLVLKKYLCGWAKAPKLLEILSPYLQDPENTGNPLGYIGLSNGWKILKNLFAYTDLPLKQKWELFEVWAKHDGGNEVKNHRRNLEVIVDIKGRADIWKYFLQFTKEESVQMVSEAMYGFNHEVHIQDLAAYEKQYFEALPQIFQNKDSEYAKTFYHSLYPVGENIDFYQDQSKKLLDMNLGNDFLTRFLKESIDMNERRKRTYATYSLQKE